MRRVRDQLSALLYKQPGFTDVMRRLTAVWLVAIMPLQLLVVFGFGPYHVPAWRIGQNFFAFPEPAKEVSIVVWALDFIACIAMMAGMRHRLIPVFLFAVWFYYQTFDRYIFHSSFVILMAMYLLAFAVDRQPRSLSRLLIQVALSSCYIFSALHKFHPEFFSGLTMYDLLGRGFLLRPEILPAIQWLSLPRWFTDLSSYVVIALELFIGIGLWFRQTRIFAVIAGVFMHIMFTAMIPGIELFAPITWTGYLAFFDKRSDVKVPLPNLAFDKPLVDKLVTAAACILCIAMPARLFFLPPYTYLHMSLYDRVPWGFSMFLFHEEVKYVEAVYRTQDHLWHKVPIEGRMNTTSSASDLIALAYYLSKIHPEADRIMVATCLQVNSHRLQTRQCFYTPAEDKVVFKEAISDGIRIHH